MTTEKNDYQELRKIFYKRLDFEVENLRQKSVLLTAFICLTFTIYASITSKLIMSENLTNNPIIIHEICGAISLVGIIFAIIWIMMAKSSKAWCEYYEHLIYKVERDVELCIPEKYAFGRKEFLDLNLDSNLFTSEGGKYSPSRLNIFIGQIFMLIWLVIFMVHMVNIFILCDNRYIFCTLVIVFLIMFASAICNKWAKSSFF
jgi:hypothetical protein